MSTSQSATTSSPSPSTSPSNKLLVLISGSGTNLQALIDALNIPTALPPSTTITHVISNRRDAYGLTRAAKANIPTTYHPLLPYKKRHAPTTEGITQARLAYDTDLANLIISHSPDLVVCAGWMHILSASFISALHAAGIDIINLHPAKPGEFNGANAIERAWRAATTTTTTTPSGPITETGVMVHYVVSEVDMGAPILVEPVPIRPDDSLEQLEERIHQVEWKVIVEGTRRALERRRGRGRREEK